MAKAVAPTTITLKHIADTLADTHEMAKKQSETILGDFVGLVTKHLKKGDRLRISGLGILQVRKRAARMGRNPATGRRTPALARMRPRTAGSRVAARRSASCARPDGEMPCATC